MTSFLTGRTSGTGERESSTSTPPSIYPPSTHLPIYPSIIRRLLRPRWTTTPSHAIRPPSRTSHCRSTGTRYSSPPRNLHHSIPHQLPRSGTPPVIRSQSFQTSGSQG